MIRKKDKKRKKTITDDMTPREAEWVLEYKKRVLRRWAIVVGLLALAAFGFLAMTIFDHFLKGAPDGGLEINYNKVDEKLAWLGSEIRDLDATISDALHLTSTDGVLVNNVTPASPADEAGLARGDVILSFDGTDIIDSFQIQDQIRQRDPGDTVKLVVDTVDGGKRNVYVTLGAKSDDTDATNANIKKVAGAPDTTVSPVMQTPWGISVSPLTDEVREQFDIPAAEQGVVIVAVVQGGLADSQGLEVGDVIESINQMPTPNLRSLYQALQDNENVLMDVYSPDDAKRFFVTLPDEGGSPPQVVLMSFGEEVTKTNRIIIPADSASINGTVYYRFASAPYFILYDLTENKITAIQNPYAAQIRGMGITVAQMLIDYKIDAVIVGGIGPQSYDTFYLAKVKVYGPVSGSVRTVITSYQLERLSELKEANLGGYGNSSVATIPTGGSPWTEEDDTDDEESDGLAGQPSAIPPMGKPLELTAQGDARASRPETCICPNCGAEITHPANTSCADMVCPLCGSQLMTASPGTDSITGTDITSQLPATDIPTTLRPIALTAGSTVAPTSPPSRVAAIPTASNLWALSNQPATTPVQQTAATSTQVSVCICPLDGTTVTHPIGIPCAALQCPVCGGRMVSSTSAAASTITQTAGIQTGGKPDDVPPVQQTFYLVPIAGGPPEGTGAAPSDVGMAPSDAGASTDAGGSGSPQGGRSTICICPVDGTTVTHPIGVPCAALKCPVCGSRLVNADPGGTTGGAATLTAGMLTAVTQTAGTLTGGKPDDVPPVQQTFYILPVGGKPDDVPPVQQAFYILPVGGKPDDVPPVQQAFYLVPVASQPDGVPPLGQSTQSVTQGQQVALIPTAGGPPEDMGMGGAAGGPSDGTAVDGPAQGGGQASSGAAQSGRSTLCVCPMCDVTVTHPIGVPCSSLTCPVCGSRLVNETPGGASGDTPGGNIIPSAAMTTALTSNIIQVAGASNKVVIPSTGRSLKSDIAQLLDDARYFLMFGLGTYDVVPNPYYRDKRATGAEIGQFIVSEGGAVVICNNVSASALKALKDLKVRVYTGFVGTVQQALDIYNDGRLKSSSTAGVVLDDDEEEHGGGGPPSSKDKRKDKDEKDEAEIF
ncbi:MAG: PDZ domain-containing protein [Planctomycetes bacterium]|nr:PDZ domain-containing protein [Planctomycetota bacterium]